MPKALITGINGQDGIFLSRLLIEKGYQVLGLSQHKERSALLDNSINYFSIDIRDTESISRLCVQEKPDELYNLAGISSVAKSFSDPQATTDTNFTALANLLRNLEKMRVLRDLRFFQASSSEMFGIASSEPQDERTQFQPISPYAKAKYEAHKVAVEFRDKGFFLSCGILYNHESILRPVTFVTRKITSTVAAIKLGRLSKLPIGNIEVERDWGFAGDYISAMFKIVNHNIPDDFVISSGVVHSVRDILEIAFDEAGIDGMESFLEIDQSLIRPKEVNRLLGNSTKAKTSLGWEPKKTFEEMIREMVRHDISLIKTR